MIEFNLVLYVDDNKISAGSERERYDLHTLHVKLNGYMIVWGNSEKKGNEMRTRERERERSRECGGKLANERVSMCMCERDGERLFKRNERKTQNMRIY